MSVAAGTAATTRLPVANRTATRAGLARLITANRAGFGATIAVQILASAAGLVGPQLLEHLINQGKALTPSGVSRTAVLFAIALVVQTAASSAAYSRGASVGEKALADLREGLVASVLRLPLGLVERAGTGDLMARVSTDIDEMSRAMRYGLPQLLVAGVTALLAVVALVVTAPWLGLVLVPVIPFLAWVTRRYLRQAGPAYREQMAAWVAANAALQETVSAARTVEVLGLGSRRVERSDEAIRQWMDWEKTTLRMRNFFFGSCEVSYVVPLMLCLLVGGTLVVHGSMTVGAVAAAALYAQQLIAPVDTLLAWQDEVQQASASLSRVLGVYEIEPAAYTDDLPAGPQLVARQVHFAYDGHGDVLKGVDLAPAQGEHLVIVGPSGAGKSTLALLLAGVHAPTSGSVAIGGVPPHLLEPSALRREVALVTQEHHIFATSVRENLRLARPGATDDELWEALDVVGARAAVEALADGLGTAVGSGGAALSPALAQQLAIARLVLAGPHTLVLDEATSLLGAHAARDLEQSMARLLEGRTVIAISHRLHAAHDAQIVAVVEGGRITEMGSHADLLARKGPYARLWAAWQEEGLLQG
ncbi:MAG TPA: ABC transporter ATP-binding protein [Acidimicrobiales bacterium]|nr:ABC transporter ATP-binding protein [Acidimicrobiales bacterium]